MESTEESQQGYPEEAPPGADPAGGGGRRPSEETPQRQGSKPGRRHDDRAGDTDDGKATGNRRSAG
jgi:hypothetical protein